MDENWLATTPPGLEMPLTHCLAKVFCFELRIFRPLSDGYSYIGEDSNLEFELLARVKTYMSAALTQL
jgi:hypothetical protein